MFISIKKISQPLKPENLTNKLQFITYMQARNIATNFISMLKSTKNVAFLYQVQTPPPKDGIVKPMKPGGYSDSGADIGYALKKHGINVITPVENPAVEKNLDWVFPDTNEGIQKAISQGANTLWLNTILYDGHPVEKFINEGVAVVGQEPALVDIYDDKYVTNELLKKNGLPIPPSVLISNDNLKSYKIDFAFPVVAKPIRGRGSEGVVLVKEEGELTKVLEDMFAADKFGTTVYVEQYLPGQEITITVMPPGVYQTKPGEEKKDSHWSLPSVKRFNHQNGIAPYNGIVAVINNSKVLDEQELESEQIKKVARECEQAAKLVSAKAPIRIDCRADANGDYYLFDLNMKPNMTGASRPHRQDQDSLSALAARGIGWSFTDLLVNMLGQAWTKSGK